MPVYEYRCKTCGKEFEYFQKITAEPLEKCPNEMCECEHKGEGIVERKISKNIGLVFNGKGFYLTDYVHKHSDYSNGKTKTNGNGSPAKTNSNGDSKKESTEKAPAAAQSA